MVRSMILISALAVALLGALAGSAAQEASPAASPPARAVAVTLRDVDGHAVGQVTLAEVANEAVSIEVSVEGLAPGQHGIHVHAIGVCDSAGAMPFASAGGHYNPAGAKHGGPPAMGTPAATQAMATPDAMMGHAGDLGNLLVDDAGKGRLQIATDRFRLADLNDADGSALVIHANPDDLQTDPSGNSGGRIVCGVIFPSQDGGTPMATPAS